MILPDKYNIDLYLKLFDHDVQGDILQEECAELIQAISKTKRKGLQCTKESVTEEIAHVIISINMICEIYNISDTELINEFNKKYLKYKKKGEIKNE